MKAIEGFRLDVQHDLSSSLNEEANSCCTLNLNKLWREKFMVADSYTEIFFSTSVQFVRVLVLGNNVY